MIVIGGGIRVVDGGREPITRQALRRTDLEEWQWDCFGAVWCKGGWDCMMGACGHQGGGRKTVWLVLGLLCRGGSPRAATSIDTSVKAMSGGGAGVLFSPPLLRPSYPGVLVYTDSVSECDEEKIR